MNIIIICMLIMLNCAIGLSEDNIPVDNILPLLAWKLHNDNPNKVLVYAYATKKEIIDVNNSGHGNNIDLVFNVKINPEYHQVSKHAIGDVSSSTDIIKYIVSNTILEMHDNYDIAMVLTENTMYETKRLWLHNTVSEKDAKRANTSLILRDLLEDRGCVFMDTGLGIGEITDEIIMNHSIIAKYDKVIDLLCANIIGNQDEDKYGRFLVMRHCPDMDEFRNGVSMYRGWEPWTIFVMYAMPCISAGSDECRDMLPEDHPYKQWYENNN